MLTLCKDCSRNKKAAINSSLDIVVHEEVIRMMLVFFA